MIRIKFSRRRPVGVWGIHRSMEIGRILDLGNTTGIRIVHVADHGTASEENAAAIREDWETVGQDMQKAVNKAIEEITDKKVRFTLIPFNPEKEMLTTKSIFHTLRDIRDLPQWIKPDNDKEKWRDIPEL